MANKHASMSLEQLADSDALPGSVEGISIAHQFKLRSTRAQIWAARWMMISVIVLALSSIANLALNHWSKLQPQETAAEN